MPLGMLGKYERLDVLGHGASGIVYLAKDTLLGRQIALKEISAQGEERDRVLEEARVLDRLRHPNIVHVYGVDEIGGKIVIAMEYVRGKNLQDVLRRAPTLPISEAVAVAAQICDGLAFAHRSRIVHRDVKPANILIAADGAVKLADFGLALALGTNSFAGGAGTYAYMAPEDFHEEQQSDAQADIWAVGVILYEMLAGRRPFQPAKAKDPFSWKRAIEDSPLVPISQQRDGIPPALDAVLAHALARDKQSRYADAADMAEDLRALGMDLEDSAAEAPLEASAAFSAAPFRDEPAHGTTWLLFPGEPPLTDIDSFLLTAPNHWEVARQSLVSGALAHWLTLIGETPLAGVARESADERDDDERLRDFLYRAGLDVVPEARRAYDEGLRLSRVGRYAEAVTPLQRAVRLDPTRSAYHQDLAGVLRACGDSAGAAGIQEEALRRQPPPREPLSVPAPAVPQKRGLGQIFWWYVPLLICCLAPAGAGLLARGGTLLSPGMAASALLCGSLFVLVSAAGSRWAPRLAALFLFGMMLIGAWPAVQGFAAAPGSASGSALLQCTAPALVMLILEAVALYRDPRRWGRWPLWAWITAVTGLLIAYGLLRA